MNLITLKDLRAKRLTYNWETIYVGMEMAYFTIQAISDYAVELMEGGINDEFINQLAWGVEDGDSSRILIEIKCHFNLVSEKNNDEYKLENRKLRFVYLSKLNDEVTDDKKLLDEIEKFYDNQGYSEDMNTFIGYMPQDSYTNCKILILRFHEFLNLEGEQLRLI